MSTKIYNSGRIWAENLEEVIQKITKTKQLMQPILLELILDDIYKQAIKIHEISILSHACFEEDLFEQVEKNLTLEKINKNHTSLHIANNLIDDKLREERQYGYMKEEEEINIYVFPKKIKENDKTYYIFSYTGPDQLYKKYISLIKKVEDYQYWDSTDRPENLTAKQWTKRRNDWKKVLPSGYVADDGICIKVAKQRKTMFYLLNNEKEHAKNYFDQYIQKNPLEKRIARYVNSAATKIVFEDMIKEKADKGTPVNFNSSSEPIMLYMSAQDVVKEKQMNEEQSEKVRIIEEKIKETLSEINYESITKPLLPQIEEMKTIIAKTKLEKEMPKKTKKTVKVKL